MNGPASVHFTILSAAVQGVLESGRIDVSYAQDGTGSSGHSPTRCPATARLYRNSDSWRRVTAASKT